MMGVLLLLVVCMPSAVKMLLQMELERFEALQNYEKNRVLAKVNVRAKERGFDNQDELMKQHPAVWQQLVADAMRETFPK